MITVSLLALFAEIGLRLLEPWPLKFVLDRFIQIEGQETGTGVPMLGQLDSATLLIVAALAIVVIGVLRAAAGYAHAAGFATVANRMLREVRDHVYRHMQRLSLSYHHKARSGDLIVRVTRDVNLLRDVTSTAVLPLLASVLVLLGMVAVMLWLRWELSLLAMVTIPLYWFSTVRIGRRIHDAARKQRHREAAMASTASETIGAIHDVKALSLEETFAHQFASQNAKSQKEDMKASRLTARLRQMVDVLLAIATALVMWYGAKLVLAGELTPGGLVVFLTYLKRSFNPARDFAKYTARLAKAAAAGERVLDILETEPEIRDLPGAVPAASFQGAVQFSSVSFGYEPGQLVLRSVDFEVHPGQRVAIAGPSGIGKSTLINLLLRLYDPSEGSVMIDGRDIRDYTLMSLRSQISVVLQDSILFAASVWENIGYGASDASHEQLQSAARLANADGFIRELPQGYDTVLGERGVTLSRGQRQRIAIARAVVRRSPILLLDEPTTGLDDENERAVVDALERLAEGCTTFIISHNLQLISRADRILYLDRGSLLEQGTHSELLRANGRYAELYKSHGSLLNPSA